MDLDFTPQQQAFRTEVRAWLRANVPKSPLASYDTREGFEQHRAWEAKLAAGGYSCVIWPKDLGGRGSDLNEWLIFEEEYHAVDAPMRVNQNGIMLLGPTLMEFGTAEQKAQFLPRMARCDDMWAQGWSEPNAGSDMAAITSRAPSNSCRPWDSFNDRSRITRSGCSFLIRSSAVGASSASAHTLRSASLASSSFKCSRTNS